jgi:hypothetical protein
MKSAGRTSECRLNSAAIACFGKTVFSLVLSNLTSTCIAVCRTLTWTWFVQAW